MSDQTQHSSYNALAVDPTPIPVPVPPPAPRRLPAPRIPATRAAAPAFYKFQMRYMILDAVRTGEFRTVQGGDEGEGDERVSGGDARRDGSIARPSGAGAAVSPSDQPTVTVSVSAHASVPAHAASAPRRTRCRPTSLRRSRPEAESKSGALHPPDPESTARLQHRTPVLGPRTPTSVNKRKREVGDEVETPRKGTAADIRRAHETNERPMSEPRAAPVTPYRLTRRMVRGMRGDDVATPSQGEAGEKRRRGIRV